MRLVGAFGSEIKLASASSMGGKPISPGLPSALANPDVQVLRVGKFSHPKYGEFEITRATLSEMKANFDKKIRGVDIAFDYFHNSDQEASGWPTELFLSDDGDSLWAKVDWTPTAQRKLAEREIRYFSPDFAFTWEDPESGLKYSNVLFGGGLTNRPFVKDMAAIVASEERETMTLQEIEKKLLKLAEDGEGLAKKHEALQKEHDALKTEHAAAKAKLAEYEEGEPVEKKPPAEEPDEEHEMAQLKKKLAEVDGRNKALEKQMQEMAEKKALAEKESAFNMLLSEGKACAAQKDAFMKGDVASFAKLAEPINLDGHGSASLGGKSDANADRDERVIKLAEEKRAKDSKLSQIDALTLANREIK